jgi:hypothetical protein
MLSKFWLLFLLRLHKASPAASNIIKDSTAQAIQGNKLFSNLGQPVPRGQPRKVGTEDKVDRHATRMERAVAGWGSAGAVEDEWHHKAAFLLACKRMLEAGGDAALLEDLDDDD